MAGFSSSAAFIPHSMSVFIPLIGQLIERFTDTRVSDARISINRRFQNPASELPFLRGG